MVCSLPTASLSTRADGCSGCPDTAVRITGAWPGPSIGPLPGWGRERARSRSTGRAIVQYQSTRRMPTSSISRRSPSWARSGLRCCWSACRPRSWRSHGQGAGHSCRRPPAVMRPTASTQPWTGTGRCRLSHSQRFSSVWRSSRRRGAAMDASSGASAAAAHSPHSWLWEHSSS